LQRPFPKLTICGIIPGGAIENGKSDSGVNAGNDVIKVGMMAKLPSDSKDFLSKTPISQVTTRRSTMALGLLINVKGIKQMKTKVQIHRKLCTRDESINVK
jgi:hypothetical protein